MKKASPRITLNVNNGRKTRVIGEASKDGPAEKPASSQKGEK